MGICEALNAPPCLSFPVLTSDYFPVFTYIFTLQSVAASLVFSITTDKLPSLAFSYPWSDPSHCIRCWDTPPAQLLIDHSRSKYPPMVYPHCTSYMTVAHSILSTTFLGLVFDSELTWYPQVSYLKTEALCRLWLFQTLSHVSWGANRLTLLQLHQTLVLSKLDYGCQVYSSATRSILRKLDAAHHQGLRLALGAFKSSPVTSCTMLCSFVSQILH